jgi:hypothetical protein
MVACNQPPCLEFQARLQDCHEQWMEANEDKQFHAEKAKLKEIN